MRAPKHRPQSLPRLPPASVVRIFLLALAGVIACGWALVRYYTHKRPPMVVPVTTPAAPDAGDDSGQIEIELERQ